MAIDIRTRTNEVVATIERPDFLEQIRESLPESVSLDRFKRVAITAVRSNADLATADQTSLFRSIVRCAQDGLLPDGREAALVIYKGKVGYIPMIAGIRKIAAEYGWQIRTAVVYANDEFDYTEEPPEITHRPVRPGQDRGALLAAYAVARHRDGRRMQTVLHPADIAKRRAKAQTDKVWGEWPEAMWEKSAGHDIFGQLALDSADLRVSRILNEGVLVDPVAALYGPNNDSPVLLPAGDGDAAPAVPVEPPGASGTGDTDPLRGGGASGRVAGAADEEPVEDGEWTEAPVDDEPQLSEETVAAAAAVKVPGGVHLGKTLAEVADEEGGKTWLAAQLKRLDNDDRMRPAIETFVQGRMPEMWASYEAWKAEQS